MLTAIIVAGGSSQRMGFDKTFALLDGQAGHGAFHRAFEQTEICHRDHPGRPRGAAGGIDGTGARRMPFGKVRRVIAGGARRQDSVAKGLAALAPEAEFVAVHDAARPLVRPELIERIYRLAQEHGGAASAAPVIDTLKRVNLDHEVIGGVESDGSFRGPDAADFSARPAGESLSRGWRRRARNHRRNFRGRTDRGESGSSA